MSSYPQKYLTTRKCCCCFTCDPRQVFLILSSTCLLLGLINMCSYPLCPAIIISSLVVAFYYFGSGIYLLYAVTGLHEKLLKSFPWLMLFSYVPIAAYVSCLVASLECIEKWTAHYSDGETPQSAREMYIGILCLYSMFAVIDFLFSSYSLMLSMGQFDDRTDSNPALSQTSLAVHAPYDGPFGAVTAPQVAYAALVPTTTMAAAGTASEVQLDVEDAVADAESDPPTPTSSHHSRQSLRSHHSQRSQRSQQSQEVADVAADV